jgi:UDP-2,4-diacetamido-2,4,6-trideoxy-beta-L-altropyranose hydrolase
MGHVVRSHALADELALHGMEAWFASRQSLGDPVASIESHGHRIVEVSGSPAREVANIRAALRGQSPRARPFTAVLLDHYGLGADWLREVRSLGRCRVVIDDLADRSLPCEIVVNGSPHAEAETYSGLVPSQATLLLGIRYCLLRRAFAKAHGDAGGRRVGPVRAVLITLGGGDNAGIIPLVVDGVRSALPDAAIDLVPGASEVGDMVTTPGIRIHRNADDAAMARLMLNADIAIGGGGTTSWERCALALPSISIRLASNQDAVVESLTVAGATVDAGQSKDLTAARLSELVASLAKDEELRRSMSERAWQLVDGRGAVRVAHAIDGVRVRRARVDDARILWEWANDQETRAASLDSRPIRWPDHREWLNAVLSDPSRLLIIGWNGAGLLGQVRFDNHGREAQVSISVAPEHRGTVGRHLLASGIRRYRRVFPGRMLVARVKEENRASRRLFEAAGFAIVSADKGVIRYRLGTEARAGDQTKAIR